MDGEKLLTSAQDILGFFAMCFIYLIYIVESSRRAFCATAALTKSNLTTKNIKKCELFVRC